MKFLITGATGFIGRNMVSFLVKNGHFFQILALPDTVPDSLNLPSIEVFYGDMTDSNSLYGLGENCEIVIHLASKAIDWGTNKSFYQSIYQGTQNLLEATFKRVDRFVYVSSIAAVGGNRHLDGFTEADTCLQTGMPYGDVKLETEELVREYAQNYGIPISIVRPGSVVGPGSVWTREPLKMMKSFPGLPLVDRGRHLANLIDVMDMVNGIYLTATLPQAVGKTYFFVSDWDITWKQYLEDLGKLAGVRPKGSIPYGVAYKLGYICEKIFVPLGIRPPLTRHGVASVGRNHLVSTQKARKELGWQPLVSYEEALEKIKQSLEEEEHVFSA